MQKKIILLTLLFLSLVNLVDEKIQLVDNLYASVLTDNFQITQIKNLKAIPQAGDVVSIIGENLGDDNDEVEISISGEKYDAINNYGREITFALEESMRSGEIFVTKTEKDKDGETVGTYESNRLYLDLDEASIRKIESVGKLLPGESLKISGNNLDNATFYCDDEELEAEEQTDSYAVVTLPDQALECTIRTKKNNFEFDSKQEITIEASASYLGLAWKENSYFLVEGKNFENYKDSLDNIKLVFDNGNSLDDPTYVSDTQLKFEKGTTVIPASGTAALKIGDRIFPARSYTAQSGFANIISVGELSGEDDASSKVSFEVTLNKDWGSLESPVLKVAGSNATVEGSTNHVKAIVSESISTDDQMWIEAGGFSGKKFRYSFEELDDTPHITSILAESSWGASGGRGIRINGNNFGKLADTTISSGIGTIEVEKSTSSAITALLPYGASDGTYTLSVKVNGRGSSNSVGFSIPASRGVLFYPEPDVKKLDFISGPFVGKKLNILGENFVEITSVNFNGKSVKPNWFNAKKIEVIIPSGIDKTGKLKVISNSKIESKEVNYEIQNTPSSSRIRIGFSDTDPATEKDEWKNLFAFEVENSKEKVTLDDIQFIYSEKNPLPLTAYRLVNAEGEEVDDADISLDSDERKITISNLAVPVSAETEKYTLQGEVFSLLSDEANYTLRLSEAKAHNADNQSSEVMVDKTARKTIRLRADGELGKKICQEYYQGKWIECRQNVRRPVQRPSAHWGNINTRIRQQ